MLQQPLYERIFLVGRQPVFMSFGDDPADKCAQIIEIGCCLGSLAREHRGGDAG